MRAILQNARGVSDADKRDAESKVEAEIIKAFGSEQAADAAYQSHLKVIETTGSGAAEWDAVTAKAEQIALSDWSRPEDVYFDFDA